MSPKGAELLLKEIEQLERDEVPEEYCPRFFYCGHKLLCTIGPPEDAPIFVGKESGKKYEMTDRIGKWKCYSCQHIWTGEDGTTCPKCKDYSNN